MGCRLKSDGVGFMEEKPSLVGWSVTECVSSLVGASVGCSQYGVGAADTKSDLVGWLVAPGSFVGTDVGLKPAGVGTDETKPSKVG